MADCEQPIIVNPEDNEQNINLTPENDSQSIDVDVENSEQNIEVQPTEPDAELEIDQEQGEQCLMLGHECISVSGIADYEALQNKPEINGNTLEGDQTLDDLGFSAISEAEITEIAGGEQPTCDPAEYLSQCGLAFYHGVILQLLDEKVDKVAGKGLSSNDFTDTQKNKLAGIEAGAQKNVIEDVKVNGTSLTVTNKSVDVPVPTTTSELDNNSGFITSADIPEIPTKTSQLENDSGFIDKTVSTLNNYFTKQQTNSLVATEANVRALADQALDDAIDQNTSKINQNTSRITQVEQNLASEENTRRNADNALQAQIDGIHEPTKTSELTNDSGFITSADIPTVPTKTSELTNDSGFITSADVPTKTSELTNDSGFITASSVPTKTSDLTNDSGFIDSSALDDYYDKDETDALLADKQDKLTAGTNITIDQDNVISATGGSQVTLYSDVGRNTDGAMTQRAVFDMIWLSNDQQTTQLGKRAPGSYGGNSLSFGWQARGQGTFSTAIGNNAYAGYDAMAIGNSASANSNESLALGWNAKAQNEGSVALGNGSKPSRNWEVNIGTTGVLGDYGGFDDDTRILGGVHDGLLGTDAVNLSQLTTVQNSIPTATSDLTNDSGFITSSDIPAIPTKTSELTNDSGFITSADIPAIPTKTSDLTNDSGFITSADVPTKTSELTNDSGFITTADVPTKTSELTNDSGFITSADLPTVNDATLTIQKNGTNVATFTANSATAQTANITVPTATSELTNDSGFISSADISNKYDKAGGEITGDVKIDGNLTLDIDDPDYDSGIRFTKALDSNLGTVLTLTGYADNTNYKPIIRNVGTPNADYDVANKKYVDDHILTPVTYLVGLDNTGAIDAVASSLNYATVKGYLTNSSKDVYLDVLYEPSRFFVKAVQDEDTNNGPINFIGSYSRGGKMFTALFMLDSSDNLTVLHLEPELTYEKAQAITSTNISSTTEYPTTKAVADYVASELAPTVIYSDATGLSPLQADVSASIAYQLTNLDLSPYKRIKVHIGSAGSSGTGFKSSGLIELSLDANLANATTGQWVGSVITENASDRNRLSAFLVAVSPDKTSFAYARATSLYGTGATNISDSFVKLIEGFKY